MLAARSAWRLAIQLVLCGMTVLSAFAQSDDISQRLQRALAASGGSERAVAALASKNFAQLEQMLARAKPSTETERAELLALQGVVKFLEKRMDAAVAAFTEAAKLAPLSDSDKFTQAMAFVNLRDDTDARSLLSDLAEKHPDRAIYVYWLGRLDYDQRRYVEAVEKLRRATELDPKSPRTWDSLGLALDMQGQMEQALEAFEKAVSLNRMQGHPSPWPAHDLGYVLLRLDRLQDAENALRESLRYDSSFTQAHYHLGRTLEKEGNPTEAIDEYLAAVSSDPEASDACYSLAMLYRKLHRDAEADAMFAELKRRKQAGGNSALAHDAGRE
jgi:tetratricopeptide (TPR) repeat protein